MTTLRHDAVERYGKSFGEFPPMLYLYHLEDADFIGIIDDAIASGVQIDPEQFNSDGDGYLDHGRITSASGPSEVQEKIDTWIESDGIPVDGTPEL